MRNAPAPSAPPPAGVPRAQRQGHRPRPAADPDSHGRRSARNASLTVIAPSAFPTKPRLVSSAHGPIGHVLLWYPTHSAADAEPYKRTYGDLLANLPATTEVTIVAHPKVVKEITALADARRAATSTTTIVKAPASVAFSVWAEDAFVVVTTSTAGRRSRSSSSPSASPGWATSRWPSWSPPPRRWRRPRAP